MDQPLECVVTCSEHLYVGYKRLYMVKSNPPVPRIGLVSLCLCALCYFPRIEVACSSQGISLS